MESISFSTFSIAYRGDENVKYASVVFRGEAMTMMVMINGGQRTCVKAPMMTYTNARGSYLIQGTCDNVLRVCYRSNTKGWVEMRLFT